MVTGAMATYLRLTGAATLLIGLQVFSPERVWAITQPSLSDHNQTHTLVVLADKVNSLKPNQNQVDPPPPDPNKKKPKDTGAGGGRYY